MLPPIRRDDRGYTWVQTVGDTVVLSDSMVAAPTFTSPSTAAPQTLTFQVTVTDDDGATNTDTVDVAVTAQLALSDPPDIAADFGDTFNATLPAATGGFGVVTHATTGLPPGASFSSQTLLLSGTAASVGTSTVTYIAIDAANAQASQMFDWWCRRSWRARPGW